MGQALLQTKMSSLLSSTIDSMVGYHDGDLGFWLTFSPTVFGFPGSPELGLGERNLGFLDQRKPSVCPLLQSTDSS